LSHTNQNLKHYLRKLHEGGIIYSDEKIRNFLISLCSSKEIGWEINLGQLGSWRWFHIYKAGCTDRDLDR